MACRTQRLQQNSSRQNLAWPVRHQSAPPSRIFDLLYAPSVLKLLITLRTVVQISTYHSRYPCYSSLSSASILIIPPAVICTLSHSRLSLLSSALCRQCHHYRYPPRSTEPIPLVLRHVVPQILPLRCGHLSLLSYPLALILSLFILVVVFYIYVTDRSIQASQEFGP
jgi:hypothetical protein